MPTHPLATLPVRPMLAALSALCACGDANASPLRVSAPATLAADPASVYSSTPLVDVDGRAVPPPPAPDWDAGAPVLGARAFTASAFAIRAPRSLADAFSALTYGDGSLRIFAAELTPADAGLSVRYGAADADGTGFAFQEPDVVRSFRAASAASMPNSWVSEPFTYELRARVTSGLSSTGQFGLALDARNAIWTATLGDDERSLEDGALYGLVTRAEAERRAIDVRGFCPAVCGLTAKACAGDGVRTLADVFDCTDTPLDADLDGNGEADAYRLVIGFRAERAVLDVPSP